MMQDVARETLDQLIDLLRCPKCGEDLHASDDGVECSACRQRYPVIDNIPRLFWPNEWDHSKSDVTEAMKKFYERTPFPNYDEFDSVGTLIEKARKGIFAKSLDDQIPFGTRILECGCGTGQLSNFLSAANRIVIGTDLCVNSLKLAQAFKERHHLNRARFLQMNLFRPALKPKSFDLVISNGVLHHTADPFLGFQTISNLVKPNGYIMIGLYHQYGRVLTDIRRILFRIDRKKFEFLDSRLKDENYGEIRRNTWFADQYKNPHESKHTISEVLGWFSKTGVEFVKSIPKARINSRFDEKEKLFNAERPGERLELFVKELMMMFTNSKDGGLFVVIGQKKV